MKNKKAIGPVIATALLIVVAVVSVVAFQSWFTTFSSETTKDVDEKSDSGNFDTGIENIVGSDLYFRNGNDENISIKSITIAETDCNISQNFNSGINSVDIGDCASNVSGQKTDVSIITDKGVYTKRFYIEDIAAFGQFIDSEVEGLEYSSGKYSGLTDSNGKFKYKSGSTITFKIGDVVLGSAKSKKILTPQDLTKASSASDNTTNMVRFLMSLDEDSNPDNGLKINSAVREYLKGKSVDFNLDTVSFENNISPIITALFPGRSVVSSQDAKAHFESSLREINGVTYYGNFFEQVPTGAIVPFNQTNCPSGWTDFTAANGRILLGAGSGNFDKKNNALSLRSVGDSGGLEYTTGIPATLEIATLNSPDGNNLAIASILLYGLITTNISYINGNYSDSNLPPSYVMKYCVKTGTDNSTNSNAVLSFDNPSCPINWTDASFMNARFTLGAGSGNTDSKSASLTSRNVGDNTGFEMTTTIPVSNEPATNNTPNTTRMLATGSGNDKIYTNDSSYPASLSGNELEGNMPPYYTVEKCSASTESALTSGTIVAFDSSTCPSGWSEYTKARGRMLLGAGSGNDDAIGNSLSTREFGNYGGLEYTSGILAQTSDGNLAIPSISEITYLAQGNTPGGRGGGTESKPLYSSSSADTTIYGDKVDSNMPPYYTVLYCVKD